MNKKGFTFVEVLVTLGIIGVVAAMTLPTLIKNYKYKVLENQLKKGYSTVSQALLMMYADTGIDINFNNYPNRTFYNEFVKYLKVNPKSSNSINGIIDTYSANYRNYNNTAPADASSFDEGQMIINDAMAIYIQDSTQQYGLIISVDVNGINKKPNRWGHDLFSFRVEDNGKLSPLANPNIADIYSYYRYYCSKSSQSILNGMACAYYAINNICPDDNTKSYWSCLPK